ncbi:MAG: PEGA domain-containing protein [Polyangiales bacterium]
MPRRACLALVLGSLLSLPLDASAQAPADPYAEADRLERQALASWDAERPAEALPVLERAVQGPHRPRTTAQLGLLEARLGRWVRAEAHVQEALGAPDAWVRENRERIERALERIRSRVASLELECNVPGATVWIADEQIGTLPAARPLRVPVGSTPVEVRAEGHLPVVLRVTVDAGQTAHERATLMPVAPAVTAPVVAAPAVTAPAVVAPPLTAPPPPAPTGLSTGRVLAWVSVGAGGLMLVGGAVALGVQQSAASDFDRTTNNCRPAAGQLPAMSCASLQATNQNASVAMAVLFGGAALFAGVAAVLFATSPATAPRPTALHCGPGPGTAGIACGMAF